MRYFLRLPNGSPPLLKWLLELDSMPTVLPLFPENGDVGLVVAHLISGEVYAEVLPHPGSLIEACGAGFPLGRLYFQIPRDRLYSVCPRLTPEIFGG